MALRKQDFYEGAALYLLAKGGQVKSIVPRLPFFLINDRLLIHLKYSTKGRSPWGFTFMPDEQAFLENSAKKHPIVIGLVCGADGVAAVDYDDYRSVAVPRDTSLHVACYRKHQKHYEVSGPDGQLAHKVAPSVWQNILG